MKPVTENMSDKEHRGVTRELAVRAIPLQTTGAPAVNARFLGDAALSSAGVWYKAKSVGNGASDWVQDTGFPSPTVFTAVAQGEVPASGGGTTNFLRADGAWTSANPRVFVETQTGVGPWTFSTFNTAETGLLGYEFELAIVNPTTDVVLRINGDTGANYGRVGGAARTYAIVGTNPGGPPGGVRGVVELRGVATGLVRTIGVARVTSFESTIPSVAANPQDACWSGVAALASVSVIPLAGAADASSAVSLFKVMRVS